MSRISDTSSPYNKIRGAGAEAREGGGHAAPFSQRPEEAPELGDVNLALAPILERELRTLSPAGSTQPHPLYKAET